VYFTVKTTANFYAKTGTTHKGHRSVPCTDIASYTQATVSGRTKHKNNVTMKLVSMENKKVLHISVCVGVGGRVDGLVGECVYVRV
jgi:hypothetical protein